MQQEDIIALFNTTAHELQLDGAVEGVRLVRDPKTNLGKGIGYVLFKSRSAALAALRLDGLECKGRKMRVQRVQAESGTANGKAHAKAGGEKGTLSRTQGRQWLAGQAMELQGAPGLAARKTRPSKHNENARVWLLKKVTGNPESACLSFAAGSPKCLAAGPRPVVGNTTARIVVLLVRNNHGNF